MKKLMNRALFFIGWLLSPFTFWNDSFVNIPLAYICAVIFTKFYSFNFLAVVLVFYWLSNGLGIIMMLLSGQNLLGEGKEFRHEALKLVLTLVVYSTVLILLGKLGILKPI